MDLASFVAAHRTQTKAENPCTLQTHMSFATGTFPLYIAETEEDLFRKVYLEHITTTKDLSVGPNSITERVGPVFALFVDLDFKIDWFAQGLLTVQKVYDMMLSIQDVYKSVVSDAFEGEHECRSAFRTIYKCHLYFPTVFVTGSQAQSLLYDARARTEKLFPEFGYWKMVFDSQPYFSSGLRMLGSHKGNMKSKSMEKAKHDEVFKGKLAYEYVYRLGDLEKGEVRYKSITLDDLRLTSIRRGKEALPFRDTYKCEMPIKKKFLTAVNTEESSEQKQTKTDVDPETVRMLQDYLSRALRYHNMKAEFRTIERRDNGHYIIKLNPQHCPIGNRLHTRCFRNEVANYVIVTPFNISLRCYRCCDTDKEDAIVLEDPDEKLVAHLEGTTADYYLKRSLYFTTHESVSEFIFQLLKDNYAASCNSLNGSYTWYYYEERLHRWIEYEKILMAIMMEHGPVQTAYAQFLYRAKDMPDVTEEHIKTWKSIYKKLQAELQTTHFVKGGLLPLLARKFDLYWRHNEANFQARLDKNPKLISMTNGVWDFESRVFRTGSPRDFISMSTHVEYVPWKKVDPVIREELMTFLNQVYTDQEHRDYVLQEIASCLDGTPTQQRFFIMTGAGANAKSTLVRLLNLAMGDYAGEVNITLFTHARPPANCATPELVQIKGKRFVSCSEPNARDSLNLGTIKWLSGGDRIVARGLHQQNQSFYLQATFFCLTNDIPPINATQTDHSVWRRIRTICHNSKFVENPTEPNEFKTDDTINEKLDRWKGAFISLLVDTLLNKQRTLPPPPEFAFLLQQLVDKNDVYGRFIKEWVEKDTMDYFTDANNLHVQLNEWLKSLKINRFVNYDSFEKHMTINLGEMVHRDGKKGWNVKCRFSVPNLYSL